MNLYSATSRKASQLRSVQYLANRIVLYVRRKTPLLTVGSRISTASEFQTVGPRQRRPADRACCVDTAERSSSAGWLIIDVDWRLVAHYHSYARAT